ncbi:hypothetical protein [Streptomyces sp. NRRL S-146]|uniref:hypothetical protein n=1 Tax=Streptomyces sp. NRRL S-146 TaxID=1463884 RepID=UPI0004C7A9F7|nr:hypothetical protein [Streptomyces sp. NRRL S-146]
MTTHTNPHQKVIAAALEDWWITTDPLEPFDPDTVADRVELYLLTSGYYIAPDTGIPPMHTPAPPSRTSVAITTLLALACLAGGLASMAHDNWFWAIAGASGAFMLSLEVRDELAERRAHRRQGTR